MKPFAARLLAAAALLSIPAALSAHRMWLLPSATVFSGTDGWVTVDAAVSNDLFFFDHQPLRLDGVKVWQPDGSEGKLQNGATGRYRSMFDVKLDKPGTWKIGTQMSARHGQLQGRWRREAPRRSSRSAAAGRARPADRRRHPRQRDRREDHRGVGPQRDLRDRGRADHHRLQADRQGPRVRTVTHPDELVAGETAKFRFLVDGKPAAGPEGHGDPRRQALSQRRGRDAS